LLQDNKQRASAFAKTGGINQYPQNKEKIVNQTSQPAIRR